MDLSRLEQACADRLRAMADGDREAEMAAEARRRDAAAAAIAAGVDLADLGEAESAARDRVREEAGPDALRRLARAAVRVREAAADRDRQAARAVRLGLSRRAVAEAAGLSVGAIKALSADGREGSDVPASPFEVRTAGADQQVDSAEEGSS